jgi:PPOX class probable F420-dependent enzyme
VIVLEPTSRTSSALRPPAAAAVVRSMVRVQSLLATARVIWLSSTRPDGRPHVVPTWFDWDGETITIFTRADAQKVRNVRCQPRVMVAIGIADTTFQVELLEGEALVIDETSGHGLVRPSDGFARKYAEAFQSNGFTIDSFALQFPHAIRVRLTRLLDWGAREATF